MGLVRQLSVMFREQRCEQEHRSGLLAPLQVSSTVVRCGTADARYLPGPIQSSFQRCSLHSASRAFRQSLLTAQQAVASTPQLRSDARPCVRALPSSGKKKSHGWCDFASSTAVLDQRGGFSPNDTVTISAEIFVLHESVTFERDGGSEYSSSSGSGEIMSGKFIWRVLNWSLFSEMIKTQKIMSPVFPAGECSLRLSVYQSLVVRSQGPI